MKKKMKRLSLTSGEPVTWRNQNSKASLLPLYSDLRAEDLIYKTLKTLEGRPESPDGRDYFDECGDDQGSQYH